MKYLIITFLASVLAFISCDEPFMGQPPTDGIPPAPVTNVTHINTAGGAMLKYDLPADEDLLYVKAKYARSKDVIAQVKASVYTNELCIEGIGKTDELDVELVAVDRSGNESTPVYIKIQPLTAPLTGVRASLSAEAALSGIQLNWDNEHLLNLSITVLRWDKNEYTPIDVIYSSAKIGNYGVRGQKAIETKFAVYMKDKWSNYSDTLYTTLTPIYEEKVIGATNYYMATVDGTPAWQDWGFRPESMFDDSKTDGGYHTETGDGKWPHSITFKTPKPYRLRRFKLYQRQSDDYIFSKQNAKKYELWGIATQPPVNGSYDGWTLIGTFDVRKPSGLPLGTLTAEDRQAAVLGNEHLITENEDFFIYYRLKVLEVWDGSKNFYCQRMQLFGIPDDFDPNAPVE